MYYLDSKENYSPTLRDLVDAGVPIFNDWWNTYVPEYKQTLITKIIHAYYFEQIGSETPDRFIWHLNAQLEQIMPYYNQLYASELIKVNPLMNHYMETNGRSIENILSKANTSDDKFAKAIRDFTGVSDKSGAENRTEKVLGDTERTDSKKDEYSKTGTEDITDHSKTDGTENEKFSESKVTDGRVTEDKTSNETTHTGRDLDRTVTENPGEQSVKKMDWGAHELDTEILVGKDTSNGSGSKDWTETRDDNSTTKTTTNLSETSSSDGEKDYADTPQKSLPVSAQDGTARIRSDYLTNVTWTSDSSKHDADTVQDIAFADDETKTHKESSTDENTTEKHHTIDNTKQKSGTDTETTTRSGSNVTTTKDNESTDSETDVSANTVTIDKTNVDTDSTRDFLTTDETAATRDKDWTENGSANGSLNSTVNVVTNTSGNVANNETAQTKELSDLSQSSTANQIKESEETSDKGSTSITSGYMNVSASALLEAFRKTFLNIDKMIIDELRDNFMLIY